MGKETKIGLAVIAVLVTVFGVLLFRHLKASHALPSRSETAQAEIKPLAAPAIESGDVVVTPSDSKIADSKLWDTPAEEAVESAPTPSYMPVEPSDREYRDSEFVESDAAERYAPPAEPRPLAVENAGPTRRSPFQSAGATGEPSAVAPVAGQATSGGNPLRRTSAELPLDANDESNGSAEFASDAPAANPVLTVPSTDATAASDPYAMDAAPAETEPYDALDASNEFAAESGSQAFEAPESAAANRDPFETAAPATTASPATDAYSDDFAPVQAAPTRAASGTPRAAEPTVADPYDTPAARPRANAFEPASSPASEFDRFESPQAAPTADQPLANQPAADEWRGGAPAAAPLAADVGAAAPLPIENGMYTVQPGDSLWTVSEAVYGTGGYFKALAAHNRAVLPRSDALTVGTQISVPAVEDLQRDFPSLCPRERKSAVVRAGATRASAVQPVRSGKDVYIVNEGDTLFDIARYELGKATRWAEIYDLNREILGEDFDYLRPGTELVMPPRETTEAATRSVERRY